MGTISNFYVNPNLQGTNGFGRILGNAFSIYNTEVAATTNVSLPVPASPGVGRMVYSANSSEAPAVLVIFSANINFFVAVTTPNNGVTTAAPDISGTFVLKPGILNPTAIWVNSADTLQIYPLAQGYMSVEFYSVN